MSLLCDRQIEERCVKPYGVLKSNDSSAWLPVIPGVTHEQSQIDNWEARHYARFHKVKNDEDLAQYMDWRPMIHPFVPEAVRSIQHIVHSEEVDHLGLMTSTGRATREQKIISYGLSSYGYDIRIKGEGIKLFTNISGAVIDPMRPYEGQLADPVIHYDEEFGLEYFVLPPNSVALAHTVEYFVIPRDILVTCIGKSTYARVGLAQIVTPLEPEWEGELVLEIASMTNSATRVYVGCGIAQLNFNKADEVCRVSYKDRGGKYQGQRGTQLAKL